MDVSFIEDNGLIEEYNAIWDKVSADIRKRIFENQNKISWW